MVTLRQRYLLEREIGRGATGSVWLSRDLQLGRRVAIKLLRLDCSNDAEAQLRFEREAQTIAQLRSPYVVQVYDFGVVETQSFIVMELLEGESLEARLARHPQLPLPLAARFVVDVAKGLAMTHEAGVVHRDIKPANIFLARDPGQGREVAKLLDFGVARFASIRPEAQLPGTVEGSGVCGTPLYMSPEQRSGCSAAPSCDVWSLAVVAYEMLTGRCPFDGASLAELDARIVRGTFPSPSEIVPGLTAALDAVFERAFAREESARFQSVLEFSAALVALGGTQQARRVRLLFIDDEPDMRLLIEHKFRHQIAAGRYELHFALDGEEGLELLARLPDVDAVLTDLKMPRCDGLEFLERLPSVNPLVRAVVVSAYGDMQNIRTAMNRGAFDFLGKPIDFDDLERTVDKCVMHADQLRAALQSHEENELLRMLVGRGVVDRHLTSMRAGERLECKTFDATVVFADIAHFSQLLEREPAHVAFRHLNASFELFVCEIVSRGGAVSRFVGDAVMAVFDGPDHIVRAVEACFAIVDRTRSLDPDEAHGIVERCGVTFGLHSGPLVSGGAESVGGGRMEAILLGEAVSTAARLQSAAPEFELLITDGSRAKLAMHYHIEEAGSRVLREGQESVPLFRVLRRRNREGAGERASQQTAIATQLSPVHTK